MRGLVSYGAPYLLGKGSFTASIDHETCIACGVFASSLTENQIVSAAVTFGILLFVGLLAWSANLDSPVVKEVVTHLSLLKHVEEFGKGIIDTRDVVYLLNFTFVFLFLTSRTLESKKWRG